MLSQYQAYDFERLLGMFVTGHIVPVVRSVPMRVSSSSTWSTASPLFAPGAVSKALRTPGTVISITQRAVFFGNEPAVARSRPKRGSAAAVAGVGQGM